MNKATLQRRSRNLAVALLAFSIGSAQAADEQPSMFAIHGFGTLGLVHSDARGADFVGSFFEPNGAGATRRWAFGPDTKGGIQLDARFTDQLSAVVQVVSQHRYNNTYDPTLEWANVKYQVTPDLDVRIGRTVAMTFMVSESRLVGYSNLWIRPPQEVYGLVPITNKDGVDGTYRFRVGEATSSLHASYGGTSLKLPASGRVKASRFFDISNSVDYGPTTLRLSYATGRVSLHTQALDTLTDAFTTFGNTLAPVPLPAFAAASAQAFDIASRYRFENAPISVLTAGASYDRDRWVAMAEWAKFQGHSLLADSTAWYATIGYRVGTFTPYATIARLHAERNTETGIATTGLPPAVAASAAALNAGLNTAIPAARFAQRSATIGARWDIMRNAALKIQYDRLDLESGSSGRLGLNVGPGFQPGQKVNVFSIALDFLF